MYLMRRYFDLENRFIEMFNMTNGFYIRTGVINNQGKDTGIDPFMRDFPQLLDIGIMQKCINAFQCPVGCYQGGSAKNGQNMSLSLYKDIIDQCENKIFQVALGGLGDPNHHEKFEEILRYTREHNIIPNYTTSGINLTNKQVEITKELCGAVAVSQYFIQQTYAAIDMFVKSGMKTNIHFVLSNKSIDKAIDMLLDPHSGDIGLNAVVFLLHKPVGLGKYEDVLNVKDDRLIKFLDIVNNWKGSYKLGFDACTIPCLINGAKNVDPILYDTCEGGRYSAYISSDGIMVPCSFDSKRKWGVNLKDFTIKEAWESDLFYDFRSKMVNACPDCEKRTTCKGGCPIVPEIVLCDSNNRVIF